MKIAIFTDTYLPDRNGVSSSIDHYTRLLADDGHQIMIFCPKCGFYKDKKYPNISVTRYKSVTPPSYKDIKFAIPFIWTIIKDLKSFAPDIVHVQTPMGVGLMGIWASNILKMKNIQTYHTYIPDFLVYFGPKALLGINKLTNYINNKKLSKNVGIHEEKIDIDESVNIKQYIKQIALEVEKEEEKSKTSKLTDRLGRNYTRLVYNRADLVLTPSQSMKRELKKQGVKVQIEVMSNGIDYDFFKKKTDYSIKNKIVNIGRLGFEKRVDVLIEAFAIAIKANPKLRLDIFGDGPAKKSLQTLAKKLCVSKQIRFWGMYDINKVSQQLYTYDCFATASPIETEGIVIMEAMASGLPVLGVNKLAVPDIVKDGKNGYLARPSDPKDMARIMLKVLESSKVLQRLGKSALGSAKSHEVKVLKDRLFGFYKRMLK